MIIKKISSKTNSKIKLLKRLQQKKYRESLNSFVVENTTIIVDGLKAGFQFKQLFVNRKFISKHKKLLETLLIKPETEIYQIDDHLTNYLSELETPPGIWAIYEKIYRPINFDKPVVYLNGISDPGNLGAILRCCAAFGFINVVLDEKCVDLYNAKVINAAKNAIFILNFDFDHNLTFLTNLSKQMPLIATTVDGHEDIKLAPTQFCLIFGNETRGISNDILEIVDQKIKIKMKPDIESINVANAAAIILHANYQF